ncbi:LOW QUALITY PROTEIN: follicle-stimulating hormone receptor-like [Centruroides vittatus]|uniref:LOW QUALITY PROTEIN: follicle-stimulating hormone receptor-like n=1 Tax=Centruroides vittatus TaxID=120091 RepID=UPI00350FD47A
MTPTDNNLRLIAAAHWLTLVWIQVTGNITSTCPKQCVCSRKNGEDSVDCSRSSLSIVPEDVPETALLLNLNHNSLKELPQPLTNLPFLREFTATHNHIDQIGADTFVSTPNLFLIDVSDNPIENCTFRQLFHLKQLIVSKAYRLRRFPNISVLPSLEHIRLDRGLLEFVPDDLCQKTPKLKSLNLQSNRLNVLPKLDHCLGLRLLDVRYNHIKLLPNSHFLYQSKLVDLFLSHNLLKSIGGQSFLGLENLQVLNLMDNKIIEIHPEAFVPLKELRDLNLGNNYFPKLPTRGLKNIRQLKTFNNPNLKEFPSPQAFPKVHNLALSYSYHCCAFLHSVSVAPPPLSSLKESILWLAKDDIDDSLWLSNASNFWSAYANISGKLSSQFWNNLAKEYADDMLQYEEYYHDYKFVLNSEENLNQPLQCLPVPGPFLPCEDLFGWWTLRCGVWVVFLLAMLGNGTVVTVLLFGRSRMDVPRFLVCNLAIADFFMGIYLGILAVVDASTLGEFKMHAILWQTSAGCQIAGFLGVLSSELSVYTLSVITLERKYAITNAMHLNKRLSLRHAGYIMAIGWIFALSMSVLPLVGISDYKKFAICLPFEADTHLSIAYIVFLIMANGVSFLILMACYLKMYCSIRGSQAWNSNEYRIAKRMALLVFTDFLCWAPIAFFSLSAISGLQLISTEEAKVFAIFVLPLNSCANPFLYAIFTKQFKKDCIWICKRIEESRVTRGIGRYQHSSNFSNHQTVANTNSLTDKPMKKIKKEPKDWKIWAKNWLLCHEDSKPNAGEEYTLTITQIQNHMQCRHKHASSISSENFSSRSDSWKQAAISLRGLERHGFQESRKLLRRSSGESSSSMRPESSTSTFKLSKSSVSSDSQNPCRHMNIETGERGRAIDLNLSPPRTKRKLCRQIALDDTLPSTLLTESLRKKEMEGRQIKEQAI